MSISATLLPGPLGPLSPTCPSQSQLLLGALNLHLEEGRGDGNLCDRLERRRAGETPATVLGNGAAEQTYLLLVPLPVLPNTSSLTYRVIPQKPRHDRCLMRSRRNEENRLQCRDECPLGGGSAGVWPR